MATIGKEPFGVVVLFLADTLFDETGFGGLDFIFALGLFHSMRLNAHEILEFL